MMRQVGRIAYQGRHSTGTVERPEISQVAGEQRVRDAPIGAAAALDHRRVPQLLERGAGRCGAGPVRRLPAGYAAGDGESEAMQAAQALNGLLVVDALALRRSRPGDQADARDLSALGRRQRPVRRQHRAPHA